jgi:hypothetical protein
MKDDRGHGREHADLTGKRFGMLQVMWPAGRKFEGAQSRVVWQCACDCGKLHLVTGARLTSRHTASCGCFRVISGVTHAIHGESRKHKRSKEYQAFVQARGRCNRPTHEKWKYYGGRGIRFLFNSFPEFLAEIGRAPSPSHSLDRINTNGNYEKGNVKWSTRSEQMFNRRPYSRNINNRPNLAGQVFTWLTARWPEGTKAHNTIWLCSCTCGNLAHVSAGNLKNGHTRNCGCGKRGKCPIPA